MAGSVMGRTTMNEGDTEMICIHRALIRGIAGLVVIALAASALPNAGAAQQAKKPKPTHSDVSYGPHERNVLDLWLAESDDPTPLVVYIHGGGFRGGNKNSINGRTLTELLDGGISVAALHYRLISNKPLPAAHHDCRRALQFLRANADKWNLDKTRVGAFGGSAGAQLCMYLAFHDCMADPDAKDTISRESTRLTAVGTSGGQTTMDFDWWMKNIPGYDKPHRDLSETFDSEQERAAIVREISAMALISKDDPPIYMTYGMAPDAPVPSDSERARGWKVHHVAFGVKLKEQMDALGIEADLAYPGVKPKYASMAEFFKTKLLK
jgi:acetyl esterase/lipase